MCCFLVVSFEEFVPFAFSSIGPLHDLVMSPTPQVTLQAHLLAVRALAVDEEANFLFACSEVGFWSLRIVTWTCGAKECLSVVAVIILTIMITE